MRKYCVALLLGALVLVLTAGVGFGIAGNGPARDKDAANQKTKDEFDGPRSKEQRVLREKAISLKLHGKVAADAKVVKVGKGKKAKYIELAREGTDRIFVVIAEFGNNRHSAFPDSVGGVPASDALVFDGPLHNAIPAPDRSKDNSTLWQADFTQSHYQDMYFNRMAKYYESQSSGRYSVNGDVTAWVKVPFNEARYGRNVCGGIVCSNTWFLIRDAMAYWVKGELDAGKTSAEIATYLRTFDVKDRYDIDNDGNFNEPDGFIDHFQIVHAGGDEAAGDPQQGTDAIWSHRWYAAISGGGPGGLPGVNAGQGGPSGGLPGGIPNNPVGVWVGDYTVQPENGGLGVFAHEFGHDAFGLPDLYDTSGNTGGAENSTGFWTLMSSGANIGDGGPNGIGDAPTDFGAWEKFQIGWLDAQGDKGPFYDVARAGEKPSKHKLGPAEGATKKDAQALFVVLPDKEVSTNVGSPFAGSYFYTSQAGNDLDNSMTRSIALPAGSVTLAFQARYQIETCWDYAYVEVSTDGGTTFSPIQTSASTTDDENGQNFGFGITGTSGEPKVCDNLGTPTWVPVTADLSPYAGTTVQLRFRYWTDGAVVGSGFSVDDIAIGALPPDGGETDPGWTYAGFLRTTGVITTSYFNAYIAENRGYRLYDTSLSTAYNFGFLDQFPDKVESYPYQDGLLISYWDTSQADNNVGQHPGSGLILPVDAHPTFFHTYDGHLLRPRTLTFDSTFGLKKTDAITLHKNSQETMIPKQPAVSVFDDMKTWWFNSDGDAATGSHVGRYQPGWVGVDVPKTGTQIKIKDIKEGGNVIEVEVKPAK